MTVQLDAARVADVASALDRQCTTMRGFADHLTAVGRRFGLVAEVANGGLIAGEAADELADVASVLRLRLELATFADERSIGYEPAEADYTAAVRQLREGLGDGVGAAGDGLDPQRLLAQQILGISVADPTQLDTTRRVLDEGSADEVGEYWALLDVDDQDLAIDRATPSVSARFVAGDIELDDVQIVALRGQPIPADGPAPPNGPGTDWAGTEIVVDEHVVWAYDQEPQPVAGGWVCSVVQFGSPIPSPVSTDPVGGTIDAASTANSIRTLVRDGSVLVPSTAARSVPLVSLFVGAADLGLCRLGVGSGYPIDTSRTVNERGEEVYAGSGSPTQRNMDLNGLPLSPDPRQRDEQMWRAEHDGDPLPYEPYPGFPAYEVNAVGYEGGD